MVLSRLTKITGPGVATDTNWVGNNADFTGITTTATSFNIGVTTIHSNLIEAHNIKSTGIITATGGSFSGNVTAVDGTFTGNVSIAGTLTYEDVTNVDSVGIVTAAAVDVDDFLDVGSNIKLGNAGVITATSFVGSGAALTGIDATSIKDSGGNVKIQAQASGAIHTGVSTFQDLDVDGHTNLDNLSIAGVTTTSDNIIIPDDKKLILGTQTGRQLHLYHNMVGSSNHVIESTSSSNHLIIKASVINPRSDYFSFRNKAHNQNVFLIDADGSTTLFYNGNSKLTTENTGVNITGIVTATSADINGDLDVDGHTNLDNVSIAGVSTHVGLSQFQNTINLTHASAGQNYIYFNEDLQFAKNGTGTRLKIDSSGNVLVGTTDSTVYNNSSGNGIVLRGGDVIDVARSNDLQLTLNRMGNDGPHIAFYKGGGVKSYISTRNDAFCIDVNSTNERLRITSDGKLIISTNANTTAALDYAGIHFSSDNSTVSEGLFINNVAANTGDNASLSFSTDSGNRKKSAISHVDTGAYGRGDLVFSIDPDADSGALDIVAHEKLRITAAGQVNIHSGSNSLGSLRIGGNYDSTGQSNATAKLGTLMMPHFTNAEEPIQMIRGYSDSSLSLVSIGGGTNSANAATKISLYTSSTTTGNGSERIRVLPNGRVHIRPSNTDYTMNSNSTNLIIGDGGGAVGMTFLTAGAADGQFISFQANETLSRAEGEISYGPPSTSTAADRNNMMFRVNSAERFRITSSGQLLLGTTSGNELLVIKRNDAVGPTITLENNSNLAYINNWGSSGGGSGRTNRFEINATEQAQASYCAPYHTFMTGGTGDSYEKMRIHASGSTQIYKGDLLLGPDSVSQMEATIRAWGCSLWFTTIDSNYYHDSGGYFRQFYNKGSYRGDNYLTATNCDIETGVGPQNRVFWKGASSNSRAEGSLNLNVGYRGAWFAISRTAPNYTADSYIFDGNAGGRVSISFDGFGNNMDTTELSFHAGSSPGLNSGDSTVGGRLGNASNDTTLKMYAVGVNMENYNAPNSKRAGNHLGISVINENGTDYTATTASRLSENLINNGVGGGTNTTTEFTWGNRHSNDRTASSGLQFSQILYFDDIQLNSAQWDYLEHYFKVMYGNG